MARERSIATIDSLEPVTTTEGLSPHEYTTLALIGSELDPGGVSEWQAKQAMKKAGFTELAAGLAIQSLRRKGFVTLDVQSDPNGDPFTVCKITDAGVDWLLANLNNINLHIVRSEEPPEEAAPDAQYVVIFIRQDAMRKNEKAAPTAPTTTQQLGSLIKSARDIMRKDKGLSGDLDRLPMLTWIMFLKFLDDMEQIEESRAKLGRKKYRPAIEPPYRWRDWAANEEGITGPELLAFINQEEAARPDGKKGPGLFAYLRSLRAANGRGDRRTVIATVFQGVINRMTSGYLLRDVINKVDGIHFTAQEELFTLGSLYESMLKEMRDAAGDNGEFYTPRAVVRFMVDVIDPQLGETVLDPACGTAGFLVETYNHLAKQCKTVQDRKVLQEQSIFGGEAKPLPYLLGQMNLLLHGLESPQIDPENSLRFPLNEIGDRDRVDVILTNPPFGGEEERGILGNFPEDKQTAETALLFLQLIMRKLRRPNLPSSNRERG